MVKSSESEGLLTSIGEMLDMLTDYPGAAKRVSDPLPSLLEQCEAMLSTRAKKEPVRTLHHLACTGGTIISKVVAALPNSILLSEIDPLSEMAMKRNYPKFAPTDLILSLRHSLRAIDEDVLIAVFGSSLVTLRDDLERRGQVLIVRDHAHSHFCTDRDPDSRPTLREIVESHVSTRSLVTVRHPLDSFLSLRNNDWHSHFKPSTLEEYARRSQAFLERYRGVARVRYEDFIADPQGQLVEICRILDLDFSGDAVALVDIVHLSGDSGRKSNVISPRLRREIPEDVKREAANSEGYIRLCVEMGYDPRPDEGLS